MRTINWVDFDKKNPNKTEAFEKMCINLFCRINNIPNSMVSQDYNQPGLEIFPILVGKKYIGIQCKYCEDSTKFYKEAYDSVCIAFEKYEKLDKIVLFSQLKLNGSFRKNSVRGKIIKKGKEHNCEIEFFCNARFDLELSKYPDIYDYFFSNEKIKTLFSNIVSIEERNFLNSKLFFDLKINDSPLSEKLIEFSNKGIYLIEGKAGTGKTEILKKIYLLYENQYYNFQKNEVQDNVTDDFKANCIKPIFIRLRELNTIDLLSKINFIKNNYNLVEEDCKFIYLLDGVDEIDSDNFIGCISSINKLKQLDNTYAIYISTRLDTTNYWVLIDQIPEIKKYQINSFNEEDKLQYINLNCQSTDIKKISDIIIKNKYMFNDIFSLSILCNNSNIVTEDTTIVELIEINLNLIDKINYKKIHSLNLPNNKNQCLRKIMTMIAYEMAKKTNLSISMKNIQEIISNLYPKLDYISINQIIETLCMMYFDVKYGIENADSFLMFNHKRYYEYFLYLYVKDKMYDDPFILRDLEIFSKREFFISFILTQEIKNSYMNKDFLKSSYLGFIISRLSKDYCRPYFNAWITNEKLNDYFEVSFYDNTFVDYLCLLSENEIKAIVDNDELIFNSFINSHNNSYLLFSYLLKNKIDLAWIYNGKEIDFNNFDEEQAYYFLYKYLKKEIDFEKIRCTIFKCFDEMPIINEKSSMIVIKNDNTYSLCIIFEYLIKFELNNFYKIINDKELNSDRFEKLCFILLDDKNSWILSQLNKNTVFRDLIKLKLKENITNDNYLCIFAVNYLITNEKKDNENVKKFIDKHNTNQLMNWKDGENILSILSISLTEEIRYYHNEYRIVAKVKELLFTSTDNKKETIVNLINAINDFSYDWSNFFTYDLSIFISTNLVELGFDSSLIRNFVDSVLPTRINKFAFIYNIFRRDQYLFSIIFDNKYITKLFEDNKYVIYEYDTLSQKQIMYSNMISLFNKDLFYSNIQKSINYAVFRPVYSKENIVSIREPEAFYLMIINDLLDQNEKEIYLERSLLQLDVVKETLYRSYYPNKLKYLYKIINPTFDYDFDYSTLEEIPLEPTYDSRLKKFDSNFVSSNCVDEYNIYSFDFWCECISFLKVNNNLNWIYKFLIDNYYPSFRATKCSSISYLIIGAMIKNNTDVNELYNLIFKNFSTDGYYQLLFAGIYSGSNALATKMFINGYNLVDLMVYYDRIHFENSDYKIKLDKKIMHIVYCSKKDDYISVNDDDGLLYMKDTDIYIKKPDIFDENKNTWSDFNEEWATFYGHTAKCAVYSVLYKGFKIANVAVLSVDEGRAIIPILDYDTGEYHNDEYLFSLLLCDKAIVDSYIYQAKNRILKK